MKLTPVFMVAGLILYGLTPFVFTKETMYWGLALSTVVFSIAGGLAEVLTSPTIASLPSDNPERLLSKLHSCYAWGVVFVVILTTVFLFFAGSQNWFYIPFLFALLPLLSAILFLGAPVPKMETPKKAEKSLSLLKNKDVILCVLCIFLGGAAECTVSQWCSSYVEQAFGIEKIWGDIFGVALFGAMLGLGRSLYGKFGKNAVKVLFFGAVGAGVCYVIAFASPIPVLGLIGCALTGFFVSMLWPGSLIVSSERVPQGGVALYAMMAAGGDLGASLVPQLVGIIADVVLASDGGNQVALSLGLTPDALAIRAGICFATIIPLSAIFVFAVMQRRYKKYPVSISETCNKES